jgi:hypothetical protein
MNPVAEIASAGNQYGCHQGDADQRVQKSSHVQDATSVGQIPSPPVIISLQLNEYHVAPPKLKDGDSRPSDFAKQNNAASASVETVSTIKMLTGAAIDIRIVKVSHDIDLTSDAQTPVEDALPAKSAPSTYSKNGAVQSLDGKNSIDISSDALPSSTAPDTARQPPAGSTLDLADQFEASRTQAPAAGMFTVAA